MTTDAAPQTVLIADHFDVTRAALASIITAMNLRVVQAVDASTSINLIQHQAIDLVLFDHAMGISDGFEIARYVQGLDLKIPCVLMTGEQTSDLLGYARSLGVQHILTKPIDPKRLQTVIGQILGRRAQIKGALSYAVSTTPLPQTPAQFMARVIDLARKNVLGGFGGPFASIVSDANGYVLGEGVNLKSSRFDPVAHAEVMAIRKATEALQQTHLEGCAIYSTSEPTRIARALIDSVGIRHIYFGLRHSEIAAFRVGVGPAYTAPLPPEVHRLASDEVAAMIKDCWTAPQSRERA
jgi:guanine deaminase